MPSKDTKYKLLISKLIKSITEINSYSLPRLANELDSQLKNLEN